MEAHILRGKQDLTINHHTEDKQMSLTVGEWEVTVYRVNGRVHVSVKNDAEKDARKILTLGQEE